MCSGRMINLVVLIIYFTQSSRVVSGLKNDLNYYETLSTNDIHTRVRRSADPRPESSLHEVQFQALGRKFHLLLKQSSPLSHDFKARVTHRNGETSEFEVDRSNFLEGRLKDDPGSKVHVQWEDGILMASISTDEDFYFVEPSWRHLEPSENHSMIAYKKSDLKWSPEDFVEGVRQKWCGVGDRDRSKLRVDESFDENLRLYPVRDSLMGHDRKKRQTQMSYVGDHTICRIVAVADYYFYENVGRNNKGRTGEYLIGMIGRINQIYKSTIWPDDNSDIKNLGFEIAELIIHEEYTTSPSPHYNMPARTNSMDDVLTMFGRDWQKFRSYCLAHLFTYQQFPGKLGLAYIASWRYSDLGGMCSETAWMGGQKMAANTGVSSYQNPGGSSALTLQATITTAHELGHNWGSEHDPDTDQCAPSYAEGGRYIMYPTAVSGYEKNHQIFSPCSRLYIYKVLMKKGYDCFHTESSSMGMCGNGRIDSGEDCDAGYQGDECCNTDCKLRETSFRCSPMNFPCCENCVIAPRGKLCIENIDDNLDCKKESRCDGYNLNCPPPIFENDTTPCNDGGQCKQGVCLGYCEARGLEPCMCTGEDICMFCCRSLSGQCEKAQPERFLQDGRPCGEKFCDGKGVCAEVRFGLVKRLFEVIEQISIDKLAQFMKDNIVWLVFWLSIPVYLIPVCIIRKRDKSAMTKDSKELERMRNERSALSPSSDLGRGEVLRVTNPVFIGNRR